MTALSPSIAVSRLPIGDSQAEDLPNPDLFKHADQDISHHLRRLSLLRPEQYLRRPRHRFRQWIETFSVQGAGA
jgi:hypothetical protein